jgi:hypothetical protein
MNKAIKIFFLISGLASGNLLASNAIRVLDLGEIVIQEVSCNPDQTVNVTVRQPLFTPFACMEAWRAFEDYFDVEIHNITLLDENNNPYYLLDSDEAPENT